MDYWIIYSYEDTLLVYQTCSMLFVRNSEIMTESGRDDNNLHFVEFEFVTANGVHDVTKLMHR